MKTKTDCKWIFLRAHKMKRNLLVIIVSMIIFSSCNSEKKYQENLNCTLNIMVQVLLESERQTDRIIDVWETAIYKNKYNGKYCRDFNDALADFMPKLRSESIFQELTSFVDSIDIKMQELKKYPPKYKDAFYEMAELVPLVKEIFQNVEYLSGSLLLYPTKQKELGNEIMTRIYAIQMKYLDSKYVLVFKSKIGQQKSEAYVENNCVYFRGEKILAGNDKIGYSKCFFMKEQNKVIYIKELKSDEYFEGIDPIISGIYFYDITTKASKQIVSYEESEGECIYDLIGLDDCFYFQTGGFTAGSFHVCKYSFSTKKIIDLGYGGLFDVIKEGKYKGYPIVSVDEYIDDSPYAKYVARWIIDDKGNKIGCLGYIDFDGEESFPDIEYDYDNVKFVSPPRYAK